MDHVLHTRRLSLCIRSQSDEPKLRVEVVSPLIHWNPFTKLKRRERLSWVEYSDHTPNSLHCLCFTNHISVLNTSYSYLIWRNSSIRIRIRVGIKLLPEVIDLIKNFDISFSDLTENYSLSLSTKFWIPFPKPLCIDWFTKSRSCRNGLCRFHSVS